MADFALNRLKVERSEWRKNHPYVSNYTLKKT